MFTLGAGAMVQELMSHSQIAVLFHQCCLQHHSLNFFSIFPILSPSSFLSMLSLISFQDCFLVPFFILSPASLLFILSLASFPDCFSLFPILSLASFPDWFLVSFPCSLYPHFYTIFIHYFQTTFLAISCLIPRLLSASFHNCFHGHLKPL